MKYTINTNTKEITIQSSFTYDQFLDTLKKYEGYTFKVNHIIDYNYQLN